ncbi:hypothetical protein ACM39_08930 [Chryseobacterium sp. FH2]|uniref:class I SAM-dependent methyltransferase n=1 Tax=Chryseobacterium sp. FH2 TaxID=1674291 RepID=UPI00065D7822|nr:class I SAM-dependent methyltransferase [Chryseobacterium sp. FH2]KMQ68653.1 hypothetical protein ACM39_08930 [Chryseobacterium sp. FH2]
MDALDTTNRFSHRADNYTMYRPEYPEDIVTFLEQTTGLNSNSVIADIGSGTGIFSNLLLKAGYSVNAVEPNEQMRSSAEINLQKYPGFASIEGTAEKTTLADSSIDLITVAQAFHWFRPQETKTEFERILKPSGHILLVWNIMQSDTPFLKDYTALKEKYSEKIKHEHRADLQRIQNIFYPSPVTTQNFRQTQQLNEEGLKGHLLSFSTIPLANEPRYEEMMVKVADLFDKYNNNGFISMEYETKLFLVSLSK